MPIRSLKDMNDAPHFEAAFPNAIPDQLLVNVDDDGEVRTQVLRPTRKKSTTEGA